MLTHGWPGSALELLDALEPLTAAGFVVLAAAHSGLLGPAVLGEPRRRHAVARRAAARRGPRRRAGRCTVADHLIGAGARELAFRLEAMASGLAHLAILDALLVAVSERDPARSQAALSVYADVLAEHGL